MIDLLVVRILIMAKFAIKLETDRRKIAAQGLVHLPLVSICNSETACHRNHAELVLKRPLRQKQFAPQEK